MAWLGTEGPVETRILPRETVSGITTGPAIIEDAWSTVIVPGRAVLRMAVPLARRHGLTTVALGGGVFQNRILAELVLQGLADAGLQALLPQQVPAGDGGLAWGQALVALARRD